MNGLMAASVVISPPNTPMTCVVVWFTPLETVNTDLVVLGDLAAGPPMISIGIQPTYPYPPREA